MALGLFYNPAKRLASVYKRMAQEFIHANSGLPRAGPYLTTAWRAAIAVGWFIAPRCTWPEGSIRRGVNHDKVVAGKGAIQ